MSNCKSRARVSQFWMNLLEHSPDLVMSTVYLHMKDKKASGNINNIPVADVLAFYSGVTIYIFVACSTPTCH
jgi:hypothetical protein